MKLSFFLVIGLMVNTMMAVMYPNQIFGNAPLDMSSTLDANLGEYITVNSTSDLGSYNAVSGQVEYNSQIFGNLKNTVTSTEGKEGIFSSDLFSIVDWVKTGMNSIKTAAMFVIGFIVLLFNLAYPFNLLIGIPFAALYSFSIVAFIMGRF